MKTFRLTEIRIYPIKSLGGIRLERAAVRQKGLQYDRRWMLVDEDGVAMTQRQYPRMALFRPRIETDGISVSFMRNGEVISSTSFGIQPSGELRQARVWNDIVEVVEADPAVSRWFSEHLETPCTLVAFPEEKPRPVDPRFSVNRENVSLADAYPFLLIGQSSLDDLNERLPSPVPMDRFRPNFVVEGADPYAEDNWKQFSIGKIRFLAVKKSDRCIMTTVNQETAEKGPEPLRTLSSYRKEGTKVFFGQNLLALDEGEVRTGDSVIPG